MGRRWEIDHKRPMSSFNLEDPNEQHACCHFSNLRPMDAFKNRQKQAAWDQQTAFAL